MFQSNNNNQKNKTEQSPLYQSAHGFFGMTPVKKSIQTSLTCNMVTVVSLFAKATSQTKLFKITMADLI